MRVNIDRDGVTLLHEGDRPTKRRFGGDVRDHETVGCTRESAIGNECNFVAEPLAHERCGYGEHLAHSWSTNGAFVANHYDVARHNCVRTDRSEGGLFRIKDARWAAVMSALVTGELHDRTFGCQTAA
jgi:hypothetical protein